MRRRTMNQLGVGALMSLILPLVRADETTPQNNVAPILVDWLFEDASTKRQLDMNEPQRWSYLFRAERLDTLEALKETLLADGYRFETFVRLTERSAEPGYLLIMMKVEHHSVASLKARNAHLTEVGAIHGAAYQFMDVAAVR